MEDFETNVGVAGALVTSFRLYTCDLGSSPASGPAPINFRFIRKFRSRVTHLIQPHMKESYRSLANNSHHEYRNGCHMVVTASWNVFVTYKLNQ